MIPQRPAFFPENAGVRPDPRFIPSAGGAQWQGTRQEQNDVLFLSDYIDFVKEETLCWGKGNTYLTLSGKCQRVVVAI